MKKSFICLFSSNNLNNFLMIKSSLSSSCFLVINFNVWIVFLI